MDHFENILLFLAFSLSFLNHLCSGGICGDFNKSISLPTTEKTDPKWIQQALDETNRVRANHGAPPLTLNQELVQISQDWAYTLATVHHKLVHTIYAMGSSKCGENLFSYNSRPDKDGDGGVAIREFYNEIVYYDYKTHKKKTEYEGVKDIKIGHFTQAIWKGSKEFGIAMHKINDSNGQVFVAATYFPAGNVQGQYDQNVLPMIPNPTGPAPPPAIPPPSQGTNQGGEGASKPGALPPAPGAGISGQLGRGLPPCALPRPYTGKWRPTGKKRVCNRALNIRMEKAKQHGR